MGLRGLDKLFQRQFGQNRVGELIGYSKVEAIILEDDCVPNPTFFRFCQEMLDRYRHDQRIGMISGDNFQFGRRRNDDSYYFSKYVHVWGWASWRDRWVGSYDVTMARWPRIRDEGWLVDIVGNRRKPLTGTIFSKAYTVVTLTLGTTSGCSPIG